VGGEEGGISIAPKRLLILKEAMALWYTDGCRGKKEEVLSSTKRGTKDRRGRKRLDGISRNPLNL